MGEWTGSSDERECGWWRITEKEIGRRLFTTDDQMCSLGVRLGHFVIPDPTRKIR